MRTYCFIGGPTPGNRDVFFRRLEAVGGLPAGWSVYPHQRRRYGAAHRPR